MDEVRKCSTCKTISSKFSFYKERTKKDGYRPSCKICCKSCY